MIMRTLLLLASATLTAAWADTLTVTASNPGFPNQNVFSGSQLSYAVQNLTLQGPTDLLGPWTLTINTNYGTDLPGGSEVLPSFFDGGSELFMGDFLVQHGSNFFGVVMHAHDGYTPGDLYKASGFENSKVFHVGFPVTILPGGTLLGTGNLSVASNFPPCLGLNCAKFQVTDVFNLNALSTFVDPKSPFTFLFNSATCANGLVDGDYTPPSQVPEPGSVALLGGALVLMALLARRQRVASRPAPGPTA